MAKVRSGLDQARIAARHSRNRGYHREPEVKQVGDDREQCRLLPAMLSRGRGEGAADLAI